MQAMVEFLVTRKKPQECIVTRMVDNDVLKYATI